MSTEIAKDDLVESSHISLARIRAARGEVIEAMDDLRKLLSVAKEVKQHSYLYYWLWRIGHEEQDRLAAIPAYERYIDESPDLLAIQRLAELRGEAIPQSN